MAFLPQRIQYPLTAFGEVATAQLHPIIQVTFPLTINLITVSTGSYIGGTVTHSNAKAVLQTSTTVNSSASLQTRRALKYKTGEGGVARFTAVFSTGSSVGSLAVCGLGDIYNKPYADGFYFMMSGSSFGILRKQNGTDYFISQSEWNVDRMDGSNGSLNPSGQTLHPEFGNVYQIRFQWLGYGAQDFYLENSDTGEFQLIHKIKYANKYTTPSVFDPILPISYYVTNGSNAENVKLETPSISAFVEGTYKISGPIFSAFASSSVTNTKHILTIKNNTNFPSGSTSINKSSSFLKAISIGNIGNLTVVISVIENGILTAPTWSYVSPNQSRHIYDSVGSYTAGSGRQLASFTLVKDDSKYIDMDSLGYELYPGNTLSFIATGTATETTIGATWIEDI